MHSRFVFMKKDRECIGDALVAMSWRSLCKASAMFSWTIPDVNFSVGPLYCHTTNALLTSQHVLARSLHKGSCISDVLLKYSRCNKSIGDEWVTITCQSNITSTSGRLCLCQCGTISRMHLENFQCKHKLLIYIHTNSIYLGAFPTKIKAQKKNLSWSSPDVCSHRWCFQDAFTMLIWTSEVHRECCRCQWDQGFNSDFGHCWMYNWRSTLDIQFCCIIKGALDFISIFLFAEWFTLGMFN